MSQLQYRPDIDGLRAIAVLSVVSFHAFPALLKGGFVGVDIFFVISGFLITKIILDNLAKDIFSFADFYARRIRRIFPALILVLITCYTLGWFMLLGDEYKQLGKHIAAGAGFIANFAFWRETGYFDNIAETKPFLHLWSLGIEEQFYIVWPLLLWCAWKRKFNILFIISAIILMSFGLNVAKVHRHPATAFYSPAMRFWELLTGALLAYFTLHPLSWEAQLNLGFSGKTSSLNLSSTHKALANVQSLFGFVLIILAMVLIDKRKDFPGWWALFPCVGSFSIIAAGPQAWLNRFVLAHRIMIWFGLISFPLYLWHWPLLSFAHILEGEKLGLKTSIPLVVVSIALAWLTYKLIEKPLRHSQQTRVKAGLVVTMIALGFTGYTTYKHNGFIFRVKDRMEYANYFDNTFPDYKYLVHNGIEAKFRNECSFYNFTAMLHMHSTTAPKPSIDASCYTPKTKLSVLLWGDSHAQHLYHGLASALPPEISILQIASSGCIPSLVGSPKADDNYCVVSNRFALEMIKKQLPQIVILAQSVAHETNSNLEQIAIVLKQLGVKQVLVLGPLPYWNLPLHKLILKKYWHYTPKRLATALNPDIFITDSIMKAKYVNTNSDVKYISLLDLFCNKKGCITYVDNNKREGLVTFDINHLSPTGSIFLANKLLKPVILAELKQQGYQL